MIHIILSPSAQIKTKYSSIHNSIVSNYILFCSLLSAHLLSAVLLSFSHLCTVSLRALKVLLNKIIIVIIMINHTLLNIFSPVISLHLGMTQILAFV